MGSALCGTKMGPANCRLFQAMTHATVRSSGAFCYRSRNLRIRGNIRPQASDGSGRSDIFGRISGLTVHLLIEAETHPENIDAHLHRRLGSRSFLYRWQSQNGREGFPASSSWTMK